MNAPDVLRSRRTVEKKLPFGSSTTTSTGMTLRGARGGYVGAAERCGEDAARDPAGTNGVRFADRDRMRCNDGDGDA